MIAHKRIKIKIICLILVLSFCACFFFACNDDNDDDFNPYLADNNFEVSINEYTIDRDNPNDPNIGIEDCIGATEFSPVDFTPKYGIVFYVGTFIDPEYYTYLGIALAKQGYLVVMPKINKNNVSLNNYDPNISAFSKYPNVKFFLAGHDMGGGTAVRHAMDYAKYGYNVAGVLLYAPTNFEKQRYENGQLVLDNNGDPVWDHFSTADYRIPTLLLEVDETIRTDAMKINTEEHINTSVTTKWTLENSRSIYFHTKSVNSDAEESATIQRESTVEYTLSFLKDIVKYL